MEIVTYIVDLLKTTAFINNFLLLAFFVVFGIMFMKENSKEESPLNWIDMLIDNKTGKLSLTRLGQFIGIAVSTWIVIYLAQVKEAYQIFTMVFFGWLAFLLGAWMFRSVVDNIDKWKK